MVEASVLFTSTRQLLFSQSPCPMAPLLPQLGLPSEGSFPSVGTAHLPSSDGEKWTLREPTGSISGQGAKGFLEEMVLN